MFFGFSWSSGHQKTVKRFIISEYWPHTLCPCSQCGSAQCYERGSARSAKGKTEDALTLQEEDSFSIYAWLHRPISHWQECFISSAGVDWV